MSPEEYKKLPSSERYQLALDRNSNKKTNWQIEIEFERYAGYAGYLYNQCYIKEYNP